MAYQSNKKRVPKYFKGTLVFGKERDCKDFRAYLFNKRCCRLSNKCKKEGYGCFFSNTMDPCMGDSSFFSGLVCTGIKLDTWQEINNACRIIIKK